MASSILGYLDRISSISRLVPGRCCPVPQDCFFPIPGGGTPVRRRERAV